MQVAGKSKFINYNYLTIKKKIVSFFFLFLHGSITMNNED